MAEPITKEDFKEFKQDLKNIFLSSDHIVNPDA